MRIKNSMRNMIYVYASTLLLAVMNFVVRRVFLDVLTVDYLGYDGLFTSIFSFLNLSEMGIASIITYHMYSEIAANNIAEISRLLSIYKKIYRVVGTFVLVAGGLVSLFLPIILNDKQKESWEFIYLIYFLQLAATLCTYFLAYRRILFITHQRIYVCTTVDTAINMVGIVLKMLVLFYLRNYVVYLLIAILQNVLSNLIIAQKSVKEYPEIVNMKTTREDINSLGLFKDVKNMMATKIACTIYGSTDDIIITAMLGVDTTGLLNNYRMLSSKLQEIILSMFNSMQASIGNLVYDDDHDKSVSFFKALDLAGFFMALVCATGVIGIGQSFVLLWLKKDIYLLPFSFLVLLGVNIFIAISNNPMTYFRNSFGHFEKDRDYMIAAAAVNVVLTIIFCRPLGITGVMIGTVAGHILIYLGRTVVVHKYLLNANPMKYCALFIFRAVLLGISAVSAVFVSNWVSMLIGNALVSLLLSGVCCVAISVIIFVVSSFRTEAFKVLFAYFSKIVGVINKK